MAVVEGALSAERDGWSAHDPSDIVAAAAGHVGVIDSHSGDYDEPPPPTIAPGEMQPVPPPETQMPS